MCSTVLQTGGLHERHHETHESSEFLPTIFRNHNLVGNLPLVIVKAPALHLLLIIKGMVCRISCSNSECINLRYVLCMSFNFFKTRMLLQLSCVVQLQQVQFQLAVAAGGPCFCVVTAKTAEAAFFSHGQLH